MSVHFKMLKKLVEEPTFSQILIPLQSVLIPTLPSTGGANRKHDPFPGHWVYLAGFDDTVRPTCFNILQFSSITLNLDDTLFMILYISFHEGGDLGILAEAKKDLAQGL